MAFFGEVQENMQLKCGYLEQKGAAQNRIELMYKYHCSEYCLCLIPVSFLSTDLQLSNFSWLRRYRSLALHLSRQVVS